MTKIFKTRKSSRSTNSPFKLVKTAESESKSKKTANDPIILLTDPSSEDEKAQETVNNDNNDSTIDTTFTNLPIVDDCDIDDIISAYFSEGEEEDPNGDFAYLKLKEFFGQILREWNEEDDDDNSNDDDDTQNSEYSARFTILLDNPLLLEIEFMEMIEDHSRALIIEYVVKVFDYVRNLQLTTSNEKIKKRIVEFFKYINGMPDSEVRSDCENLKIDLIALNQGRPLEDFPEIGVVLIDLIDGKRNGLSPEEIVRIPSHKYSGPSQNKCCICLSDVEEGEDVIKLDKCLHEFHATCLTSWLKISNQCPICRFVVN